MAKRKAARKGLCLYIIPAISGEGPFFCDQKAVKSHHPILVCKSHSKQFDLWAANGRASDIFRAMERYLKFKNQIKETANDRDKRPSRTD